MKLFRFLGNEIILGTLIAVLSVFTAFASYQGSVADSKQSENEVLGMQKLNDGNAEYLSANQFIVYDYTMYDGWYVTDEATKSAYYEANYSPALNASLQANPEEPFNEAYYDSMHAAAKALWDESNAAFALAGEWNNRGDNLQLVMLSTALGLAFAAWASLLKEESKLRPLFALAATLALLWGLM